MSTDEAIDRRIDWTSWATWVLLAFILGIAAWTLGTVTIDQGRDRSAIRAQTEALDAQNVLLREQNATLSGLVDRQAASRGEADARLQAALSGVQGLLIDYFAVHDENVSEKLNELLRRIEGLLGRPAGEPLDPVTALPYAATTPARAPAPSTAPSVRPPAPTGQSPSGTTSTTTTPSQRRCANDPDHPRC